MWVANIFPQFVICFLILLIVIIAPLIFLFNSWICSYGALLWWPLGFYILRSDLHCNAKWAPSFSPRFVKQGWKWIPQHHAVWPKNRILLAKHTSQGSARREKVSRSLSSHYPIERHTSTWVISWTEWFWCSVEESPALPHYSSFL